MNRGDELLLTLKTRVTKADVLLRAGQACGLFLDFQGQMHLREMSWSSLCLSMSSCTFGARRAGEQRGLRIPHSSGRDRSPLRGEARVLRFLPARCARETQLSFLQTELSRSTALCGGTVAVPGKWRLREVPILLLPLFSGPCVSRQDPSDVLPGLYF